MNILNLVSFLNRELQNNCWQFLPHQIFLQEEWGKGEAESVRDPGWKLNKCHGYDTFESCLKDKASIPLDELK